MISSGGGGDEGKPISLPPPGFQEVLNVYLKGNKLFVLTEKGEFTLKMAKTRKRKKRRRDDDDDDDD